MLPGPSKTINNSHHHHHHHHHCRNNSTQFFKVDKEKSLVWLSRSSLKEKTENLIIAAQDQALKTHYHHHQNIMQQSNESKYIMCLL
jgi:hypothetical protein